MNGLKNENIQNSDGTSREKSIKESEILEEILELSRDNQKLLRNPDSKIVAEIERVKEMLDRISSRELLFTVDLLNERDSSCLHVRNSFI